MIERRQFIKNLSLGSASLSISPLIQSLHARATLKGNPNLKRVVFVVKSSGIDRFNLVPDGIENHFANLQNNTPLGGRERRLGALVNKSLTGLKLPGKLAALKEFQDQLTIIQSLSGEGFSGDHTSGYGALSCHNSERVSIAPTIDCILGQHLSKGPYPMYGMATHGRLLEGSGKPSESYCYPNISAYQAGNPVPFQSSPRKAFTELFGAAVSTPKQLQNDLALNGNLMSFLSKDAQRVKKDLSGDEKERFELYLQSFESLHQIEKKKYALIPRIKKYAPKPDKRYDSLNVKSRIESYFDIATSALVTGLTNVMTIRPDTLGAKYSEIGINDSVHALGHLLEEKSTNGMNGYKAREAIEKLHLDNVARMAKKLQSMPEGDGNMLDNTLIVYMSCAGGSHHAGQSDWPFILMGGMDKKLNMGRYIEYPKYREKGHRTIANLYLTLMQAAGMPTTDSFGQLDSNLKDLDLNGPLTELLT